MRKSRFGEEQIIGILKAQQAEVGANELCRKHGISDGAFYKWRSEYCGMEVSEAKRLNLRHARELISAWRTDYSHHSPHTSLDGLTPWESHQRPVEDQNLNRANQRTRTLRGARQPGWRCRSLPLQCLSHQRRRIFHHPPAQSGVVDHDAPPPRDFLEIAIGHGISDLIEDRMQDQIPWDLRTFERNHRRDLIDKSRWLIARHDNGCDRTSRNLRPVNVTTPAGAIG